MSPFQSKTTPRVLSIQSHVVSGYCGNKSATFPLQLLEIEVDIVNSVQLSNHTQYKVARGQIFSGKDLDEICVGLKANNLLTLYDNVLSGYVADVSYIRSMATLIHDIKESRRSNGRECWYTFDPVLGDDSTGYYVPGGAQVAEAYKEMLLPLADIICPNRFEASILTGIEIGTSNSEALSQAMKAINVFHDLGVKVVVITSFEIPDEKNQLVCILSYSQAAARKRSAQEGDGDHANLQSQTWIIRIPKLDCLFTGTGDLFAALLTGWLHKTNFDLKKSLENTANSIQEILEDTLDWSLKVNDGSVQSQELRLIQNKSKIMCPKNRLAAEKFGS